MSTIPLLGETLALVAALSWSIGVIFFKISGDRWSSLSLNIFKNGFAIPLLVVLLVAMGENLTPDIPLRSWVLLALSGILGIGVADTMFFGALKRLGAGLTAVVDTSYTPVMLFLSWLVLGESMGPQVLVGAALIVVGLLVGSYTRSAEKKTRKDLVSGMVMGLLAIVIMGISVVMVKRVLNNTPYIFASLVRISSAEVSLLLAAVVSGRSRKVWKELAPSRVWRTAIPGAFFGTFVAMTAWLGGMKYTQVSTASLLNQLSTVFIFVLAALVLKEPLTKKRIASLVLAFAGAVIVVYH